MEGLRGPISEDEARSLYEESGSGHDFDHILRVTALSRRIGALEGADLPVVVTAALLHDIGESQGRGAHHVRSAELAREILQRYPEAFVNAVAHAIEAHRFRADPAPRTLEAQVVYDADKLDAIGAVGVARVFAYAGERGTPLWRRPWRDIAAEGDADAVLQPKALGAEYTPVHEFVYKLDRIPDRLYTETARALAEERLMFMRVFFDRLDAEMQGA
jgi:uncharacterized protein